MKLIKNSCAAAILLFLSSYTLANTLDVNKYLREVNLTKLINQEKSRNLSAQMNDPTGQAATRNIDEMSDFFVLAVNQKNQTIMTEFDGQQNILSQNIKDFPWIGVKDFSQTGDLNKVPTTLQEGLQLVQTCMARKQYPLSGEVHRVTIYKMQQTDQMVYDYAFKNPELPSSICEEILYIPATGECYNGAHVMCHQIVEMEKSS